MRSLRANSKSACSEVETSLTRTSPFFATPPFWKRISPTTPPSSLETTAPCTGEIEPTAESVGAQSSSFTTALDTVVGGICIGDDIILRICIAFIPKSMTTTASIAPTAIPIPRPRRDLVTKGGSSATGFATSCIG
jgi:hypothetical protein